ncbi:hypothetical protein HV824_14555 [Myxococcus sp. AM009]|uniref:hypothetical protein n=1 Tax=unclassified Myxococcus TaxID=2648731 RepID=UPI0015953EF6|nr:MULTISPECIES: hypothetical protein [unclassified Myxococcus]NVI99335.1 hypothetical protein [Myxococcus sp. AM009]NVJ13587.1 hypothetical protein [Myxococcus sp. AM010]
MPTTTSSKGPRGDIDARDFVKKGVNRALRAAGSRRGPAVRIAARALATGLAASEGATTRWIGRDALRAFARLEAKPPKPAAKAPRGKTATRPPKRSRAP